MSTGNGFLGSAVIVDLRERVKACEIRIDTLDDDHRAILLRVDQHLRDASDSEARIQGELAGLRTDIQWIRRALEERRPQSSFFGARGPFGLSFEAKNVAPFVLLVAILAVALAVWLSAR